MQVLFSTYSLKSVHLSKIMFEGKSETYPWC
ncbi:hypothetical protein T260_01320 [Geobacillus thermopakistaniensis]|uniref:Uncharacterized protein n=1 Tax=Geobacillus thermopakistaniensis (strain MAS1) TaxID=1408282 RepID=A0A7U9P7M0_GEOTM|nr:hypothetical protein T260_01320 [Geobacillus sp. MAS1]